jgi:hypothetical protein
VYPPKDRHLLDSILKFTEPSVTLLSRRGVEDPGVLLTNKLSEPCRVAMYLAEHILFFVFALEMPDVHRKPNSVEIVISGSHKMFLEGAVVIVKYIRRHSTGILGRKCRLEKGLANSKGRYVFLVRMDSPKLQ